MRKYIVTLTAETKIAALVEAESEVAAEHVAEKLAEAGQLETLNEYLSPSEFVEIDWRCKAEGAITAKSAGYDDRTVINK